MAVGFVSVILFCSHSSRIEDSITLVFRFTHTCFRNNKTYPIIPVTGSHRKPSRHYSIAEKVSQFLTCANVTYLTGIYLHGNLEDKGIGSPRHRILSDR